MGSDLSPVASYEVENRGSFIQDKNHTYPYLQNIIMVASSWWHKMQWVPMKLRQNYCF